MTETITGSNQGQDAVASQPVAVTPSTQAVDTSVQHEKLFKQSEVNDLIGRAKNEAIDRYKRESSIVSHQPNQIQPQSNFSHDDFRRMAAEEAQRLIDKRQEDAHRIAQEQDAQKIAAEFFTKLSTGKDQYPDFDNVMSDMEFGKIANTVSLARGFDNVAAMMYHLRKNPTQLASIEQLAYHQPKLAYEALTQLSTSIKDNQQAAKLKFPNEPLSQMRPSNTGTESGDMGIRDFKLKYRG